MDEMKSPLIKVPEASASILLERPAATYEKIRLGVFPAGVVVRLGERSLRFHRDNLIRWIAQGGALRPGSEQNGNGARDEPVAA